MSVASIGQDIYPPRLIEEYPDLEPYTLIEVRKNDVEVPVGSLGTVLRTVPETGNYQCAVKIETDQGPRRRVVALTHDQVRPIGPAPAAERPALELVAMAHDPEDARRNTTPPVMTEQQRKAAREKAKATNAEKREVWKAHKKAKAKAEPEPAEGEMPGDISVPSDVATEIANFSAIRDYRRRHTRPAAEPGRDWRGEASDAVRALLGQAAGGADAATLQVLVGMIASAEAMA